MSDGHYLLYIHKFRFLDFVCQAPSPFLLPLAPREGGEEEVQGTGVLRVLHILGIPGICDRQQKRSIYLSGDLTNFTFRRITGTADGSQEQLQAGTSLPCKAEPHYSKIHRAKC